MSSPSINLKDKSIDFRPRFIWSQRILAGWFLLMVLGGLSLLLITPFFPLLFFLRILFSRKEAGISLAAIMSIPLLVYMTILWHQRKTYHHTKYRL